MTSLFSILLNFVIMLILVVVGLNIIIDLLNRPLESWVARMYKKMHGGGLDIFMVVDLLWLHLIGQSPQLTVVQFQHGTLKASSYALDETSATWL